MASDTIDRLTRERDEAIKLAQTMTGMKRDKGRAEAERDSLKNRATTAEAALAVAREALEQLLDDMGKDGLCVCEAAKEQARAALDQITKEPSNGND